MAARFFLLALLASLWLFSATVRAAGPQVRWRAPAECPDRASLDAAIARTLPADLKLDALSVDAEVTRDARGYELALSLRTPSAQTARKLVAERCETLVEVVALELAMASASSDAAPSGPDVSWGARALASVGSGPGPGPSPRVGLLGLIQWRQLRVELGASADLPRTKHYGVQPEIGARFYAIAGQLRGCDVLALADLELPLCAGLEAGAWRGEGLGLDSATTASRPWLALSAGAGLRYPRHSVIAVFAGVDGLLGLLRPIFGVRNLPALYRPARLAVRGSFGVEVHFD